MKTEGLRWGVKTRLEKREGNINLCRTPEERLKFLEDNKPYEVKEIEGNLLLDEGMDLLFSLATGQGGTAFAEATAQLGVGNSSTAAARTQVDLQGASSDWQGMEANFPTAPAENDATDGRSVKFKASFADAGSDFAWEEWSIRNDATDDKNLNRKVESLGSKSGGTWTLEVEISLS